MNRGVMLMRSPRNERSADRNSGERAIDWSAFCMLAHLYNGAMAPSQGARTPTGGRRQASPRRLQSGGVESYGEDESLDHVLLGPVLHLGGLTSAPRVANRSVKLLMLKAAAGGCGEEERAHESPASSAFGRVWILSGARLLLGPARRRVGRIGEGTLSRLRELLGD